MVYFYQLFLNTDDVVLKLYTSLCQKPKCTLFVWSTVHVLLHHAIGYVIMSIILQGVFGCGCALAGMVRFALQCFHWHISDVGPEPQTQGIYITTLPMMRLSNSCREVRDTHVTTNCTSDVIKC